MSPLGISDETKQNKRCFILFRYLQIVTIISTFIQILVIIANPYISMTVYIDDDIHNSWKDRRMQQYSSVCFLHYISKSHHWQLWNIYRLFCFPVIDMVDLPSRDSSITLLLLKRYRFFVVGRNHDCRMPSRCFFFRIYEYFFDIHTSFLNSV